MSQTIIDCVDMFVFNNCLPWPGYLKLRNSICKAELWFNVKLVKTNCTASFQTKKNGIFLHMFIFGINIYTLDILCLYTFYIN